MPPDEFQAIMNAMSAGFAGVHNRIDTFKDEFNAHRIACGNLFAQIYIDEATRKGEEKGVALSLKDRIDWGKVKTGVMLAMLTLISVAAVKILFTNISNFDGFFK